MVHFSFLIESKPLLRLAIYFLKKLMFLNYFDKNEILNDHSSKTDTHHLLCGIKWASVSFWQAISIEGMIWSDHKRLNAKMRLWFLNPALKLQYFVFIQKEIESHFKFLNTKYSLKILSQNYNTRLYFFHVGI